MSSISNIVELLDYWLIHREVDDNERGLEVMKLDLSWSRALVCLEYFEFLDSAKR
jgi:hypothetical protein